MTHNNQKKIAVINDISGFGRCSVAVAMPIISALKIQCCPVPTSIFSNHTGFPSYFFDDYTEKMPAYIAQWKKLGLEFDGITSGFLGSKAQIDIVKDFIRDFKTDRTTVVVDPVMGDYGKPYATYTPQLCQEMKRLVKYADILTPNLTEACILTDTPYRGDKVPPSRVLRSHRVGTERSGTGDVFAAIIAADAVNGVPFDKSVKRAGEFVKKCILRSEELGIPRTDGVCFEELLTTLK